MKSIQRKVQLGLVAIVSATAMLVPSSLAAAQTPLNSPMAKPIIVCVRVQGGWVCYIPDKGVPAPSTNTLNLE